MTALRAACEKLVEAVDCCRSTKYESSFVLASRQIDDALSAIRAALAEEKAVEAVQVPAKPEPARAFKVGDRVRVSNGGRTALYKDQIGRVYDIEPEGRYTIGVEFEMSRRWWYAPSELSPAEVGS